MCEPIRSYACVKQTCCRPICHFLNNEIPNKLLCGVSRGMWESHKIIAITFLRTKLTYESITFLRTKLTYESSQEGIPRTYSESVASL